MSNALAINFIKNPTDENVVSLLQSLRNEKRFDLSVLIGTYFMSVFPYSIDIKDELALNAYYMGNHDLAFDIMDNILQSVNQELTWKYLFNQHFSIDHVSDRYTFYNKEKINQIVYRQKTEIPLLTLTITTCKRFDLFEKTINSIINCFDIELIDFWFCVDDNSSNEDRKKMQELYPFFTFYFKTVEEKGHPRSMNIIKNHLKTPYQLHLEDDWKFFVKRPYIKNALDVLSCNGNIGQCLFNKNYAEIESDIDVKGGSLHFTKNNFRYYIHEFVHTQEQLQIWIAKHGNGKSSNYWPHFSFRPSITKTKIYGELGDFDETKSHFEMDYAYRYVSKGYVSAFFEGIYSLHTGRLTSQKDDETKMNAYTLNNELQFHGKEKELKIKTFVINLDRRPDRWQKLDKDKLKFLDFERFPAVDGMTLKNSCQLQQIFENNDYKMRKGMVGCFMSHIQLYIQLLDSTFDYFLILEDDIDFVPDFENKIKHLFKQIKAKNNCDFVFIGHHIRDLSFADIAFDKKTFPEIEQWNTQQSLLNSLGGTTGYLVSKKGAEKFLDFLDKTGATNGIDTCIQKSADYLHIFYTKPHLIYSECFRGENNPDSNIQYEYTGFEKSVSERVNDEIEYFQSKNTLLLKVAEFENVLKYVVNKDAKNPIMYVDNNEQNLQTIKETSIFPFYFIGKKTIFVIPNQENITRYFHRYKKNNKFDVSDALIFT
jgi:GR25 family glycosyltransferase involved in LPS biosynthesis